MSLPSKPRSRGRIFLIIAVLLFAAYMASRLLSGGAQGGPPQGAGGPSPVSVAEVIARPVTLWREFSGRLAPVESAEVRARVSGIIEKIYFKDGATVRKGQPLFLIDPRPYQAAVAQAEGQLTAAQAELATARLEADRARKLMAANAIARNMHDERIARAKTAEGSVRSAKGALDAARLNLHYTQVTAPISGKTSRAEITVGNLVNSEPVLTSIVAQSPLYVSFEADEQTYLSFLRHAKTPEAVPVEMGIASEDATPHVGRIDSFDNQINPTSGTLRARAVFENKDGSLIPGLYAKVRVGTPDEEPSVLINEKAVNTDQNAKYVYVIDAANKAQYRPITLGGHSEGLRIVSSGLAAGDKIVVNGLARVRPDTEVTPMMVDMATLESLTPAAPSSPEAK